MLKKKWLLPVLPLVAAVSLHAQHPFNDPFSDPFFQDPFGDDIFKEMIQMQRQMDEMFRRMQERINQRTARLVHPSMGMYKLAAQSDFVDKGDHYEMVTNIPESKENHINIQTQNSMLTISAKIVHEEQQKTNGMVSTSKSIQSFQQSTSLPADANEGKIKSEFRNGRLVIIIPKKQGGRVVTPSKASHPTAKNPAAPKPVVETVKIPAPQKAERTKEEQSLPKVDENLKKKQPASKSIKEEKKPVTLKSDMHEMS
ncbi:MAG: Hsp20/alpha crystallin family protein [Sulfurovum sp.]|nr:Hsp20/alpha crystallin family protein [Sulfurovum sp.]